MAYLEIADLTKQFLVHKGPFAKSHEVVTAVDHVTLSIEKGEILGLVGESGCGKTTLSRLIMQLIPPTSGSVILNGERLSRPAGMEEHWWSPVGDLVREIASGESRPVKQLSVEELGLTAEEVRRRRINFQMIFQDPYASLNPRMTVFTTLSEAVRRRLPDMEGASLRAHVAELMQRVGLDPRYMRKYPHEFSGGQRQRIAIARALAPEPKLIIADEPVSALDVSIQSQILNLLRRLSRELELTMIFISHDLAVVRYIADRIAVMRAGRIVELGPATEVFERPKDPYTRQLLEAIPHIPEYA